MLTPVVEKYGRTFIGFGLVGIFSGLAGRLWLPEYSLGVFSGGVGAIWFGFGIFRLLMQKYNYKENSFVRTRFLVLWVALYGLAEWWGIQYVHPKLPMIAMKVLLQGMIFLGASINITSLVNLEKSPSSSV